MHRTNYSRFSGLSDEKNSAVTNEANKNINTEKQEIVKNIPAYGGTGENLLVESKGRYISGERKCILKRILPESLEVICNVNPSETVTFIILFDNRIQLLTFKMCLTNERFSITQIPPKHVGESSDESTQCNLFFLYDKKVKTSTILSTLEFASIKERRIEIRLNVEDSTRLFESLTLEQHISLTKMISNLPNFQNPNADRTLTSAFPSEQQRKLLAPESVQEYLANDLTSNFINGSFADEFCVTERTLVCKHLQSQQISAAEFKFGNVFTYKMIENLMFSLLLQMTTSGFHFDLFFAYCLNVLFNSPGSIDFLHLPIVPGELETLQSLIFDAAYAYKTNYSLFLKVAFQAEILISFILPHDEALQFYKYCIDVAFEKGDEVAAARMLTIHGQLLGRCKGYLGFAHQQFQKALELLEPRGKSTDLAWLLTATGWNVFSRGLSIKSYLVQAFDMFEELLNFSTNSFRQTSLFSLGQSVLDQQEQWIEEKLAATSSSLGLVFLHLNKPQQALKFLQRSLDIRLKIWNQHHPSVGYTYNNVSLCYQRLGEHDKALESSLEGLNVKRKCKCSSNELVISLNNVAINCMIRGNNEKAIDLLEEALQKEIDIDKSNVATIYTSLAFVYQRMERLSEAVSWNRKAVALRVEIHGSTHVTTVRLNNRLVSILLQMKEYKEAQIILEEQMIANQSSNVGEDLDKSLKMLGSVYLKIGEDAKANLVQQKSISELISLLNIEKDAKSKQNDSIQDDIYHNGSRENVGAPKETCYDKEHELGCEGRNHSLGLTESASPALTDQLIEEVGTVDEPNDYFSDLDEIDSDDDLYGAEDTTSHHSGHQNINENPTQSSFKTTHQQIQNDDNGVSESHVDVIPNGNKEDDDHMSVSSSPEPICGDDDNQNDADDNRFHTCIGITTNISSANQILEPLAQTKSLPHRQSKQIQSKSMVTSRVLPVSSQSAFTTVGNSSLNINNNVSKTTVTDNQMPNLYHSFTQVKGQPISQPSQEARKPFKTSTGATGKQSNRFAAKFTNSSPNVNNCPGNSRHVPLRQSDNPFLSCQIGYQQFHTKPTYVQSLPFIGSANEKAAVENTPHFGVDNHRSIAEHLPQVRSNHKPTFEELEDIKWLTPKEIDASRNVLRLVLGEFSEDSDENLFD